MEPVWPDFILYGFAEATIPRTFRNYKQGCCVSKALQIFLIEHLPLIRGRLVDKVWERRVFLFKWENEATLSAQAFILQAHVRGLPHAEAAGDTRTQEEQWQLPAAVSLGPNPVLLKLPRTEEPPGFF